MSSVSIQNNDLKVGLNKKGAEFCSLFSKTNNKEYLWQADPKYWGRHSCILFPYIGKIWNEQLRIDDKVYEAKQHGFLRDMMFDTTLITNEKVIFSFSSNVETFKIFPFEFRVNMIYELVGNKLQVIYEVENNGSKSLPFSIGGHPGFIIPLNESESRSDYSLVFQKEEKIPSLTLNKEGFIDGGNRDIFAGSNTISIANDLFDNDALIFKGLQSNYLDLVNKNNERIWTFHYEGFSHLGIWSKNRSSPFICIEPWAGLADKVNAKWDFRDKEGVIQLAKGERFSCSHSIEIH